MPVEAVQLVAMLVTTTLLGLVYRNQEIGTVGLLLVVLSFLVADIRRPSPAPWLEAGLAVLALVNLISVVALLTV